MKTGDIGPHLPGGDAEIGGNGEGGRQGSARAVIAGLT